MKFRPVVNKLFLLLFSIGVLIPLFYRAYTVNSKFSNIVSCDNCFFSLVLLSDAIIFFGIFSAILFSVMVRSNLLRILFRIIPVFLAALYLVDIGIYKQFDTRLYFEDITRYGAELEPVISQALITAGGGWVFYIAGLLALVIAGFVFSGRPSATAEKVILSFVTAVFLILSLVPVRTTYIHSWAYKNFIDVNRGNTQAREYSDAYIKKLSSAYKSPTQYCSDGLGEKPNIILLVVESLSNYQSKLLTGFNDLLPNLDKLSKSNTYYSNFLANHFATNPGLAHLLTGSTLFAPADGGKVAHPFETAWGNDNTLPDLLAGYGYYSAFLTSGNLDFAKKREWLNDIGFDYVEGHDFEGYEGRSRTAFKAVSDEILFDRSVEFINELATQGKSLFLTIETVTTHQPYIHPETRERSLQKAFRYTDEKIYAFYNALQKTGFFDNGILLITSDHRSMTPVQAEEFDSYGLLAPALIPMIVVSSNSAFPSGEVATPLQQSDVLSSIMYLVSDSYCTAPNKRNLFKPDAQERMLFHRRGDLRDRINVFYGKGRGVVQLDGDETGFTWSVDIPDKLQQQFIEFINRERIQGDKRQRDAIAKGSVPYR